jgi:hypothetical protein
MDSFTFTTLLFCLAMTMIQSGHSTCTGGYRVVYREKLDYDNIPYLPHTDFIAGWIFLQQIFFLWGYRKAEAYETRPANIPDLKQEIGCATKQSLKTFAATNNVVSPVECKRADVAKDESVTLK